MFREEKSTALAAYFLGRAGRPLSRFDLLKLMYATERFSLRDRATLIVGDRFVNMDRGPVMSKTYDLMKFGSELWDSHIKAGPVYCSLTAQVIEALDEEELECAHAAWQTYHHALKKTLEEKTAYFHNEFPEWESPRPYSQTVLEIKKILHDGLGDSAETAEEKQELIRNVASIAKASSSYAADR